MARDAFIYDAVRTPRGRGRREGSLYEVKPIHLLTTLLDALEDRNRLDTAMVDDVIMGIVNPLGEQGSVLPKSAALLNGWNEKVSGLQLNRFCASGLEAINIAAAKVSAGFADVIVAGGVESMSRVPMGSDGGPWAEDVETSFDTRYVPQGVSADLIATLDGYTREDVDGYALRSQQRAATASNEGRFSRSLVPVRDRNGLPILSKDELIRFDADLAGLARLKPSFEKVGGAGFDAVARGRYPEIGELRHVHTPGNSSGIADGAAAVLIASEEAGRTLGLAPRARVAAGTVLGSEPTIMLTGPAPVTTKLLKRIGLSPSDIDLYEVNEAFAAVVLRFLHECEVDEAKVNVNGGSIALGHPLGATGAVLVGTLIDELERKGLNRGVVTLCAASGMGIATMIERV